MTTLNKFPVPYTIPYIKGDIIYTYSIKNTKRIQKIFGGLTLKVQENKYSSTKAAMGKLGLLIKLKEHINTYSATAFLKVSSSSKFHFLFLLRKVNSPVSSKAEDVFLEFK